MAVHTISINREQWEQWRIQVFLLGGADPLGAPTSDTNTFQQKHMRKWKNWILLGGEGMRRAAPPPLDPPMESSRCFI